MLLGKNAQPIGSCIPPARPGPTPRPAAFLAALDPPARTPLLLPLARVGGVRFVTGEVGHAGGLEEGDLAPRVGRSAAQPRRLGEELRWEEVRPAGA